MIMREAKYKDYNVTVNFNGYFGCDETYTIYADSPESAEGEALEQAKGEFSVVDIEEVDEDEYEVTLQWLFVGCEETYTVSADNESEAEDNAIEEASWDLEVTEIEDA
jgi:hypothetical protein